MKIQGLKGWFLKGNLETLYLPHFHGCGCRTKNSPCKEWYSWLTEIRCARSWPVLKGAIEGKTVIEGIRHLAHDAKLLNSLMY